MMLQAPVRPTRPVGVVISALALGIAALVLILLSLGSLATALGGPHMLILLAIVPVYLGLAAWASATLMGLLRMRSWARISSLVMAGCMVGFGLLLMILVQAGQSAISSGAFPVPPIASPADLHRAFVVMTRLFLGVAGLGVVGLLYFARRTTREAFVLAQQLHTQQSPYAQAGHAAGVRYAASPITAWAAGQPQSAPDPLTDFTVARPIQPSAPPASVEGSPAGTATSYDPGQQPWSYPAPPPPPGTQHPAPSSIPAAVPEYAAGTVLIRRPVSVTIVAIVSLANAFFTLIGVVSPVPAFLFGMIVSGWPLHLYSLVWATAAAIAGLGMLRLQRPAWLLSFVLIGVSSLQFFVLLFPGPREHYMHYMASVGAGSLQSVPAGMVSLTLTLGMLMGIGVLALFAVMLWRGRRAFDPIASQAAPQDSSVQ